MNTHKLLDKFRLWVLHDPVMKQEILEAADEFFAFYEDTRSSETDGTLNGLFFEWFMFDRKTTRYLKTPVEVFIRYHCQRFSKTEKEFFNVLTVTVFGLFEVLSSDPEAASIIVKRLDSPGEWKIKDVLGSRSMKKGDAIFARVIPLLDKPVFTGWVSGFPGKSSSIKESFQNIFGGKKEITPLKPRYLLKLWSNPINWLEKGEFFCRTRLAGLWQKWRVYGKFSELETALNSGDREKYKLLNKKFLETIADPDEMESTMDILNAWWNLASGKKVGLSAPIEHAGDKPYGPIETKYLQKLTNYVCELFQKTGKSLSKEDVEAWLKETANGENGKSPFTLIYEERKSRNHPSPDKIGYLFEINKMENKSLKDASIKANEALKFMMKKDFKKATEMFEESLSVLKYDKTVSFRIFGNLGICYALMGKKSCAIEMLKEALRYNPDYDRARKHLSDIETMSEEQYQKFVKEMPDKLIMNEWKG